MSQHKNCYVYLISRPDGTPCYVGKGSGNRWKVHARRTHNTHLARIYAKYGDLPIVKLAEGLTDAEAIALEIRTIADIGREANGGPLVNMTDGGDGAAGCAKSAETRTKIGDRLRGRPQSDDHKAALSRVRKGASRSPEMRAKISATLSGREKSPDHCKAVSLAKKGKSQGPLSAEHRAAIGRAHTGKKRSDEAKAAMRVAQAKVDATQKSARITAALTGKKLSDEHRAKISEVQKGRKRSPEFKARVSAGMKALRAKQKAEREAQLVRAA